MPRNFFHPNEAPVIVPSGLCPARGKSAARGNSHHLRKLLLG
jgi:hypothetical protein